jgi:reductive dehalogenase
MARWKSLSKLYVKNLAPDQPPYQVDDQVYRRFDQRNNLTVGRPNWDEDVQKFSRRTWETRVNHIQSGESGYDVKDYSLFLAGGVTAWNLDTQINHANRGLTSWNAIGAKLPGAVDPWTGTPEEATAMVKRTARFFGADLVGIAPLDRRWIYSKSFWADGTHKEIVFEDVDEPAETDDRLIIPEKMRWVIVMGARMDHNVIKYVPSPVGCAETRVTYSRMALQVSGVAEFLRGIGYQAIPSINGLGLSVPMAIDAGFGEQGRNGKLITPEFGPSVRLCKVLTDLPLERDHPIRFGVAEFCDVCLKCADECPANAIHTGERSWGRDSISCSPGQYTWHLDNERCRRYWSMGKGDNCTACIRSCPFTKGPGLTHEFVRTAVSNVPVLNPVWRKLDDVFGYGKEEKATAFWESG